MAAAVTEKGNRISELSTYLIKKRIILLPKENTSSTVPWPSWELNLL